MATFVLVHGAFHGPWCWDRVTPLLRAMGHHVVCPDLSVPVSPAPADWLDHWTALVTMAIKTCDEPVVLVGHSRSGIIISQVAERVPDSIAGLVFLCAIVALDGESMEDVRRNLGFSGPPAVRVRRIEGSPGLTADPASVAAAIYSLSSEADKDLALSLLTPEPSEAFRIMPRLTSSGFDRVPRIYIQCRADQAIPPDLQRRMCERLSWTQILMLDSDHAPYFSKAGMLSGLFDDMAGLLSVGTVRRG